MHLGERRIPLTEATGPYTGGTSFLGHMSLYIMSVTYLSPQKYHCTVYLSNLNEAVKQLYKFTTDDFVKLTLYLPLSSIDTFANSMDPDQAQQNVGPDLGPNWLTH